MAYLIDEKDRMSDKVSDVGTDAAVRVSDPNLTGSGVAERLRITVKEGGGLGAVSARSLIPTRSLSRYMAGREVRIGALTAIAVAAGVNLEWLATGRGPMRPSAPAPVPASPEAATDARPAPAFATINVDRLAEAIRRAQRLYTEENRLPSPRRFAQILLLLYDELGADEKSSIPDET